MCAAPVAGKRHRSLSRFSAAPAALALIPNDPGVSGQPGGSQADQWNFLPGVGVDAPRAWDNLIAAGRPGGLGVKIAVLDSGLAYEDRGRFRRSPDISRFRVAHGRDFCSRFDVGTCFGTDDHPNDENGHGTHVASTIAEATNNAVGETGLAYGATIIPVKIFGASGSGDVRSVTRGIRYAVRRGAQIINVSAVFPHGSSASELPGLKHAVDDAQASGVVIVAAAGNERSPGADYPAAYRRRGDHRAQLSRQLLQLR